MSYIFSSPAQTIRMAVFKDLTFYNIHLHLWMPAL